MKKHMILIPLLSLAFIGCEKESEHKAGSTIKLEPVDHAAKERDKLQLQMIKKSIDEAPLLDKGKGIEVEVKNSNVILRGTVATPEAKEVLERVVKSTEGIKSVTSEVKVERK